MNDTYEFRIAGRVSDDLLDTFQPSKTSRKHNETRFLRTVEDAGELFGVISRCEALGLRLTSLRQLPIRTKT